MRGLDKLSRSSKRTQPGPDSSDEKQAVTFEWWMGHSWRLHTFATSKSVGAVPCYMFMHPSSSGTSGQKPVCSGPFIYQGTGLDEKKKFLSHNFSFFCVAACWVMEGTILVLPVPSDGCAHCRAEKARALEFPALTLPLCAFHPQFLDFPFLIFRRCGLDWVLTAPLTASATSRCLWRLFFFLSCSPSVCQLLPCGRRS